MVEAIDGEGLLTAAVAADEGYAGRRHIQKTRNSLDARSVGRAFEGPLPNAQDHGGAFALKARLFHPGLDRQVQDGGRHSIGLHGSRPDLRRHRGETPSRMGAGAHQR